MSDMQQRAIPFRVVIPARHGSSRLPGKPLLPIAGRPMIEQVYRRALASGATEVVVATDHPAIVEAVEGFGGEALLTSADHQSGTDRVAEVARCRGWSAEEIVVNLQGDEPDMPPVLVHQVARDMADHPQVDVTTLATPIETREQLFDPHLVKALLREDGEALYFSRAPIPWHRDEFQPGRSELPANTRFLRHVGLYAYRTGFLERFVQLAPAPIELAESLEQLRVLWYGGRIHVSLATEPPGHGVDTAEDLERARARFASQEGG